jgi:hypothetical protein
MVGLVFVDTLELSPAQWAALTCNAAGWLWWFRASEGHPQWRSGMMERRMWLTALLTFGGLWTAFWNQPTSLDQQLLFEQARYVSRLPWEALIEEIVRRPYVEYQPPFFTYWVSRIPVLWVHQLLMLPWALLCAGLIRALYGRHAALLLATPLLALMLHQPCSDTVLFGMLLIVLRLCRLAGVQQGCRPAGVSWKRIGYRLLAGLMYGLTWMIKSLTILTVPFMLPHLGFGSVLGIGMWGGYVIWSRQWFFGRYQWRFLLQQLLIQRGAKTPRKAAQTRVALPLAKRLWRTLRWRWDRLGRHAVWAAPFYLFPAWLRPWQWQGIVLAAGIMLGYGNMKYLLLDLLFVFPVIETGEDMSM